MIKQKKGQVGIEYMIIIAFVTLVTISTLSLAIYYSGQVKDDIKLNQIENFAIQLINSAESIFFSGEPSKATVRLYLPSGVQSVAINSEGIYIIAQSSHGMNKRLFTSKVPLSGTISSAEGTRKITITATSDYVLIE
ncbi:hypothetical protein KAR91_61635 [Candidatus Pacearchaeota archaeon]|nr:hypothetical protein [Candidatus Pacearchaeota archaeon]